MLSCSEMFGKKEFESYSEFYFALAVARECQRRGIKFDMSDMVIQSNILPKTEATYFKHLVSNGSIYLGSEEVSNYVVSSPLEINTDYFSDLDSCLFDETDDRYIWTYDWAVKSYTEHRFELLNISKMGNTLLHLVAYLVVAMYFGEKPKKLIEIVIDGLRVSSPYLYINLVSCTKTMKWFSDIVYMNIDFSDYSIDINYSIMYNNGVVAGRNKLWSIYEKKEFLKNENIQEGTIAILWERKGMCQSNPAGRIKGATVVRINEIGDDFVAVTRIPVNKTKEEVTDDYYDIPEDRRHLFTDMLYSKPNVMEGILSLYELGVENYLSESENLFLTLIDSNSRVVKKIKVDGNVGEVEMSEIDAIYWLLCQYEIDFDRELYKSTYCSNGDCLLWDKYGDY